MMNSNMNNLSGLVERIIDELSAAQRRQHEQKMQELSMIQNSSLRDEYVRLLLLDKFLAPIEEAQHRIQNTAKQAQWLAEKVNYHFADHGLSQEQAKELMKQLRLLAVKITQSESLNDLKLVYAVATLFVDVMSEFKHRSRHYSIERAMRKGILEPLNTCIATERNFQLRKAMLSHNSQLF